MKKRLIALAMIIAIVVSAIPVWTVTAQAAPVEYVDTSEYESLAELYKDYFRVGSACEAISHWNDKNKEIGNEYKEKLILDVFNSITCGNEMKPAYNFDASSPTLYTPDRAAVEMLDWAKANGMQMRGHTLLWHSQNAPQIYAKDFLPTSGGKPTNNGEAELDEECLVDEATLIERMKTYIYGVMEFMYSHGYADVIYAWDVLNEATDDGKPDGLRRSHWYNILGEKYIYYAFLFAREATVKYAKEYAADYGLDPAGDLSSILPKLYYNDYNEWFSTRCDNIISFLTQRKYNEGQQMVQSDVIKPDGDGTIYGDGLIDGIGMQGHISDTQNLDNYMTALQKYSAAVDEVQITELDIECTKNDDNRWLFQAKYFYDFFSRLIEEKKNGAKLVAVTLWGLTDGSSWKSQTTPLAFYDDLSKKPAFDAMVMAAKGEEFNMTLAQTMKAVKDTFVDFEPYIENGNVVAINPKTEGFYSRGSGHVADIMLMMNVNHTQKDEGVGYGLKVARKEQDATLKYDVSKYMGKTVDFSAFVKTKDKVIFLGADNDTPVYYVAQNATQEDWDYVSFRYTIPEDCPSQYFFFETDGHADIFVDDVTVHIVDETEVGPDSEPLDATYVSDMISGELVESEVEVIAPPIQSEDGAQEGAQATGTDTSASPAEITTEETPADEGIGTGVVVIIIVAAVVVIGAVAFVVLKKKKKA